MCYYYVVVFVESRSFTKRLDQLAGNGAEALLAEIQGELLRKPDRGALVPGLESGRPELQTRIVGKANEVAIVTCICTWRAVITLTCFSFLARTSKKT